MNTVLLNNRYQILQTLARGGFGETYLAIDTHMPSARKCVIKKLKPAVQTIDIPQWLQERFQREAALLEDLGESNRQIPRLYAYFSEGGDFYLIQEWIEGVTLTEKYQQQGNLSEGEVKKILVNLLPVLDFIHTRRIIHRDIKPDNIILRNSDGLPVLIDFGIVREAVATVVNSDGKTAYSIALGTPGYMASEQAAGRPVYSSDLYSLGLTAIFLLSGKTPQYLKTDPRTGEILWRDAVGDIYSNLATVIDKAVRFHPRDRFSSAGEMLTALLVHSSYQTGATVVVAPKNPDTETILTPKPKTIAVSYPEKEGRSLSWTWLLSILLLTGVMLGAFAIGFLAFLPKGQRVRPTPSPEPTISPSDTQIPPVKSPSPVQEIKPTPTPTYSPEPTPEITITPGEATITPAPEITPTPIPETSPSLDTEVAPTPVPEVTPTPDATAPPPSEPEPSPTDNPSNSGSPPSDGTPQSSSQPPVSNPDSGSANPSETLENLP